MNFGSRIQAQEMAKEFTKLCNDEGLSITERREQLHRIEENIEEFEYFNQHTISVIRDKLDNYNYCPNCGGDFLYDEENEEGYCPMCES